VVRLTWAFREFHLHLWTCPRYRLRIVKRAGAANRW
jgi:hypothetical protein